MERVRKTQDGSVLGKTHTHTLPLSSPINKQHTATDTQTHTSIQGYRDKKLKKRQYRQGEELLRLQMRNSSRGRLFGNTEKDAPTQ